MAKELEKIAKLMESNPKVPTITVAEWLALPRDGKKVRVASYGAKDRWPGVRKVPAILERELTTAGIDHDIKLYPDAGHGFLNDHDPADLSALDRLVIAPLAAAGYHELQTRDARQRILAFFRRHLKAAPAQPAARA